MVDRAHIYVCKSINFEHRKSSQFTINRYLQLKLVLWYNMHIVCMHQPTLIVEAATADVPFEI